MPTNKAWGGGGLWGKKPWGSGSSDVSGGGNYGLPWDNPNFGKEYPVSDLPGTRRKGEMPWDPPNFKREPTVPPLYPVQPPVQGGAGNWGGGRPRFELWNPQGGYEGLQGLSWDPNFNVDIPIVNPTDPTSESKIQSAHFLNWFNQIIPMMSPADLATYETQLNISLDSLDDPVAAAYFQNMLRAGADKRLGQTPTTGTNYNDRDRLREILRATTGYATAPNEAGNLTDLSKSEKWSQDLINLLTTLVGGGGGPGGANTQGVWNEDRPMNRQERRDFWNRANTWADSRMALSPDDPFTAALMTLLSPTTSTPQLTTAIGGPAQNTRGSSTKYAYGNQGYY